MPQIASLVLNWDHHWGVRVFSDKLSHSIELHQSLLCVALDPNPETLPLRYREADLVNALKTWLLDIIEQSQDLVAVYKPTLGFYTALGSGGMLLLETILQRIPPTIPVILDLKHSDLATSTALARSCFEHWQVDAVTLSPYSGQDQCTPFLVYPDKAVFILCTTTNRTATEIQGWGDPPLFTQVVQAARTWGTADQLGLEVGAIPEMLSTVRDLAPERWILTRNLWSEGTNLDHALAAGLNANGEGLLLPVSLDLLRSDTIHSELEVLQEQVNQARARPIRQCRLWTPDVCLLEAKPQVDLILQLFDLGCVLFGSYVQASGATLPYYIDLRQIISNPQIFHKALDAYARILQELHFDRIAGIPYGSLPTATGLALRLNRPMIFPRKEVKAHGTRRLVEGTFQPGETVVVVDDILITGKSVLEGVEKLESTGLVVRDIVVLIDHGQGVRERVAQKGYRVHAALTLAEITQTLYQAGRIKESEFNAFQAHLEAADAQPV